MNNKTNRPVKRIRVSLQDKVTALLKNDAESKQVTFIFGDGTKIVQELRPAFLLKKRAETIVDDLFALQHDFKAKYFTL
jgi:hypothetical protein